MKELYRIKPLKTLAWWVACSLFVFPLTAVVLGLISLPVIYFFSLLFYDINPSSYYPILNLAAVPAIGGIIGLCIAFLQRWILRTKLYWAADKWYRWTILGAAAAACVTVFIASSGLEMFLGRADNILHAMPIFMGVVSAFQFLALRHAVKQAWLWIIANVIGGIVYVGVLLNNQPSYLDPNSQLISIAMAFFAVIALGLITGFVMVFLFENKLLPMRPATGDADDHDDKPKSVWDQAI